MTDGHFQGVLITESVLQMGYDLNIMSPIGFALGCQRQSILADLIPEL